MTTRENNQAIRGRPQVKPPAVANRKVISIRLIIGAATAALLAMSLIGFAWVAERNSRMTLTSEIESRLLLEARNLATSSVDALLSSYPELTLCPLVKEIQEDRPDLAFVLVLDHENRIQGHLDLEAIGSDFTQQSELRPLNTSHELKEREAILGDSGLLVAAVPAIHANGKFLGTALVGLKKSYVDEVVARPRRSYLMVTVVLLIAGITCATILLSLLLRPVSALRAGLERIGRGDLDTPVELADKTEFGLLAESVNAMAGELQVSQRQLVEKERLGHEMDLAHEMQQSLLPEGSVQFGDYTCAGSYQAATEVGGDFFDVFRLDGDKLGLVMADVSGKGLRGCLVTSMLAVLFRSLRDLHTSPASLLVDLEESLQPYLAPGMFVTIFYGILDSTTDELTHASAAHCPALVHRAGGETEWFKTRGVPLGVLKGGALKKTLKDQVIQLAAGDLVVLFTDGLNEAWHPERREEFGFDRVASTVAAAAADGHEAVIDHLNESARLWANPEPLGDDLTLLVLQSLPAAARQKPAPAKTLAGVSMISPQEQLHEMLADVDHLTLPADLEQIRQLRPWLESCADFQRFSAKDRIRVESGLFEICANIVEHGYTRDEPHSIDVWWLPMVTVPAGSVSPPEPPAAAPEAPSTGDEAATTLSPERGYFIICDQGTNYDPRTWEPKDLSKSEVRRRGRGLGLHIVLSSTRDIVYSPETPAGNLTMLRFEPSSTPRKEELNHV